MAEASFLEPQGKEALPRLALILISTRF